MNNPDVLSASMSMIDKVFYCYEDIKKPKVISILYRKRCCSCSKKEISDKKAAFLQIMIKLERNLLKDGALATLSREKTQKLINIVTQMRGHKTAKVGDGLLRKILSVLQNIFTFQSFRTSRGIADDILNRLQERLGGMTSSSPSEKIPDFQPQTNQPSNATLLSETTSQPAKNALPVGNTNQPAKVTLPSENKGTQVNNDKANSAPTSAKSSIAAVSQTTPNLVLQPVKYDELMKMKDGEDQKQDSEGLTAWHRFFQTETYPENIKKALITLKDKAFDKTKPHPIKFLIDRYPAKFPEVRTFLEENYQKLI